MNVFFLLINDWSLMWYNVTLELQIFLTVKNIYDIVV